MAVGRFGRYDEYPFDVVISLDQAIMTKFAISHLFDPLSSDRLRRTGVSNRGAVFEGTQRFTSRRWVPFFMGLVDVAVMLGLVGLAVVVCRWWFGGRLSSLLAREALEVVAIACAVPLNFALRGLYPGYGMGGVDRVKRRLIEVLAIMGLSVLWIASSGGWTEIRGALLAALALSAVAMPISDICLRQWLLQRDAWGEPVVVVGCKEQAKPVIESLQRQPAMGLIPAAVLVDRREQAHGDVRGVPVVGSLSKLQQWSKRVRVALVTLPQQDKTRLPQIVARLPFPRVIIVPPCRTAPWLSPRDYAGTFGFEIRKNLVVHHNWLLKRTLDYAIAIPLTILTLPLIGLFMLLIRLVSPGPALFKQPRVGLGGRIFTVYKLRTMSLDAEQHLETHLDQAPEARLEWESGCKLRSDPRVLPVIGTLLRRTCLDELPQMWNVLGGQMSLVGPRPFPKYHLQMMPREFRSLRRRVLPGITGLWQTSARNSSDELKRQQELDTQYVHHWSLWLDLCILAKTLYAIVRPRCPRSTTPRSSNE